MKNRKIKFKEKRRNEKIKGNKLRIKQKKLPDSIRRFSSQPKLTLYVVRALVRTNFLSHRQSPLSLGIPSQVRF